ncbi:MAG: ligase-associated DNA damage response endonuclease PdeM [Roseivirga sp.]|nr:ligase-associated DNA damage response endonuclease PdeM [Roseivirga sp.]
MLEYQFLGQSLLLLPEKVIYWKDKGMLILADVHLGKAGHFRKSGVPISDLVHSKDIYTIEKLINEFQPKEVIFLGDLFHSDHNQGWEIFRRWIRSKEPLQFKLVLGNHDVLEAPAYHIKNLQVVEVLDCTPFSFTHIPEETTHYNLAGHIHPAVKLRGKGRQSLRLPCFWFGPEPGIFPALGSFFERHSPRLWQFYRDRAYQYQKRR